MASTAKTVAAAVVGALIGSVVTAAAMWRSDAPPVASVPVAAPAAPPRSGPSVQPVVRETKTAGEATAAQPALATVIDAVQIEVPRAGTGVLTGHVKSKDGSPVAGVTVRAWTPRTGLPARRPPSSAGSKVEDAVVNAIAYAKWSEATDRSALTDASGGWRISEILDAKYSLSASATGWSIRVAPDSDNSNVMPGAVVDFVATAVVDVPVTIVSAGDPLPEYVMVRWTDPKRGGGSSQWWTAAEPVIHVPPGTWSMTAEVGKDIRSAPVVVTAVLDVPVPAVTLQLEARNSIRGVVRFDPADAGWGEVLVNLHRRGAPDAEPTRQRGNAPRAPDWRFSLEDVEPGEYDLTVSIGHGKPVATVAVRVTGGVLQQDIVVPRLPADQFLEARVVGPDGKPLAKDEVNFGLRERWAGGGGSYGLSHSRRDDGVFLIALSTLDVGGDHGPSEWSIDVRSRTFGTRTVQFVRGTTQRIDANFADAASFVPVIEGAEGTPLAGRISVMLAQAGQDDSDAVNNPADSSLSPGRYTALLWLKDSAGAGYRGRVLARVPVDLRAGQNPVALRVPELSTLTLRVPGAAKGTNVDFRSARRPGRNGFEPPVAVGDGGTATIAELPAGLYVAMVTINGEAREMIVRVPAAGEVVFAPTTIAGLAVTVEDPSGLLAKSGFETGDVIVGMDGTAIDTTQRAWNLLYAARGRETVAVEVQRGGRRVTLTVPAGNLSRESRYGGWWEPVPR